MERIEEKWNVQNNHNKYWLKSNKANNSIIKK